MDKRKHQRFIKRLTAKFYVNHESFSGISSDLSENGLFIRTSRHFPVNTAIDIELSLPDNKVALLKGIVKRTPKPSFSAKNGIGVEIVKKDKLFIELLKYLTGIKESHSEPKNRAPDFREVPNLRVLSFSDFREENSRIGKKTVQESRQHKRFKVEDMDIHIGMSFAKKVKIINICMDGIMVKADRRLDLGNKYTVKIEYENKALTAKAAVMWSLLIEGMKDTGGNIVPLYLAGMQFTDISNRNKREEIIRSIEAAAREEMPQSSACSDNWMKVTDTNGNIPSEKSSITAGDPDTGSSEEISLKISDVYSRYKNKTLNYYEILEVHTFADSREIKRAYYSKVRELHPDRYVNLSSEMQEKLNDLLAYLNEAYHVLTNCHARVKYNGSLASRQPASISNADLAKREFEKGKIEFWNGCMSEAAGFFENAIYLDDASARYFFFYAKTLQNLGNLQKAEEAIKHALKIDPSNPDYLVEAGKICNGLGLTYRARENFEMALRIQPSNAKAHEGLNDLRNKENGGTGDNVLRPIRTVKKIFSRQV